MGKAEWSEPLWGNGPRVLRIGGLLAACLYSDWKKTGVAKITTPNEGWFRDLPLPQDIVDSGNVGQAMEVVLAYTILTWE